MSTGSWLNGDNLLLQYGTQKANPEQGGDYLSYTGDRISEVLIDLTSLSTSAAQVQSLTTFFPAGYNVFIDKVEVIADVAATGSGNTVAVGLGYFSGSTYATITSHSETSTSGGVATQTNLASLPGVSNISTTAFVNGITTTAMQAGYLTTITAGGGSFTGAYVGSQSTSTTHPNYITAQAVTGTFSAGLIRVRIYWRGYGTIIN